MNGVQQDVRHAARALWHSPAFAGIAVLTLALGIGANTAIFSVVNAVLLRPLPYAASEELVMLRERSPAIDVMSLSVPDFLAWRDQNQVFAQMSVHRGESFNLTGAGEPERLSGRMVSANLLSTLGIAPQLGRGFSLDDDAPGAAAVAMLSHGFWQRRFGGDAGIIGRTLTLGAQPHTVVGVMPESFRLFGQVDLLVAIGPWMSGREEERGMHPGLWGIARLRPGVTLAQAIADMDAVTRRLGQEFPTNEGVTARVTLLEDDLVASVRPALLVIFSAVAFVLLIACVNVANLCLTRATTRQREMALRAALGAGRWQLVRQLLSESVLLAILGGAVGILLAAWGLDLLLTLVPETIPRSAEVRIDPMALGFTLALSVATGVMFGMVPAFQASRSNVADTLKEGGGRTTAVGTPTVRNLLVVAEVSLALVLLVGAGLMLRSFARVSGLDPGFDPRDVLAARIALPDARYADGSRIAGFYDELVERVRALPGVTTAAISSGLPLRSGSENWIWPADRPLPNSDEFVLGVFYSVSPGYLGTLRIPLLRGRDFSDRDTSDTPAVCIVDERLAAQFFPGEDAVGKRMLLGPETPPLEIVGVVPNVKHYSLDGDPAVPFQFYMPYRQIPEPFMSVALRRMELVVRGDQSDALTPAVRRVVRGIDPDLPLYGVTTMTELVDRSTELRQFNTTLLAVFAGVAMLLAAVGLYGVIGHGVSQRTHEIGVRIALGATTKDVLGLVMRHGLLLGAIGVAAGSAGAMAVTGILASLLYGVSPLDPATFIVVALLLIGVAAVACYLPARRAIRLNPVAALRAN